MRNWIALLMLLVLCGCSRDVTAPGDTLTVRKPVWRVGPRETTLTFPVEFSDKAMRFVELTWTDVEFGSSIMSGGQRLYEMHWNVNGIVWEQTPAERLDIIRQHDGRELYRYTNRLTGSVTELLDDGTVTEDEWFSFFSPATLNYNLDGTRLAEVMTSPSVAELPAMNQGLKKPTTEQVICGLAGTAGKLKCMFGGGVANPLCHVAVGVSICCAIHALCS